MKVKFYDECVEIDDVKYAYTTDRVKRLFEEAGREASAIKRILPIVDNVVYVSEKNGKKREFMSGVLTVLAVLRSSYREDLYIQDVISKKLCIYRFGI